ncbi:sigma-70 family RNA polymerase sigma factor [Arthrobacter sp. AK04]|uniref:RNA polymerase sigma factor n=1 Tax=Micrococcaceae TaxID=1268 RepID=UPI0006F282E5|nr:MULTISPECIES: sigma-70 family RNA polymerase sigma factor [Micrococcaceae]MCD5342767.1 sigma-70 family RNA polymerase sigma factor [Arthrobacter sp. AK04]MCD5342769.1 sigma-70 family RNA polymerase sigma factor [Arthrobacter sp. AK04]
MTSGREAATSIDELVRHNAEDLLRYFQRRLLNDSDAAEALGELLLTAWKLRRRVPTDPTQGRMWLFVTAHNVLRDSRRTLARRSAAVERLVNDMRLLNGPTWDDTAIELRDALDRLPDEDAELVRLTYWDGLASHEAAAVLGINASTARSRLSRAKQQLRVALEEIDCEREGSTRVQAAPI